LLTSISLLKTQISFVALLKTLFHFQDTPMTTYLWRVMILIDFNVQDPA